MGRRARRGRRLALARARPGPGTTRRRPWSRASPQASSPCSTTPPPSAWRPWARSSPPPPCSASTPAAACGWTAPPGPTPARRPRHRHRPRRPAGDRRPRRADRPLPLRPAALPTAHARQAERGQKLNSLRSLGETPSSSLW